MKNVFVSIVNYNDTHNTLLLIQAIKNLKIDDINLRVVITDNASKDPIKPSDDKLAEIIQSKTNLGFAGGQNLGLRYALENGADYVMVMNTDVVIDKNIIVELLDTFRQKPDAGIVSPKIYFAPGFEFHKERYEKENLGKVIWYAGGIMDWKNVIGSHRGVDDVDRGQYEELEKTDFASGCCMMIKKEVLDGIGMFDEKYFLYYEDNDLCQRALRKGFSLYYQPKAKMWHKNAGSTGGSGSSLHDYYITRNRLIFGFKFASIRAKLALFKESLRLLSKGRRWQKKGIIDFYTGRLGKGSF